MVNVAFGYKALNSSVNVNVALPEPSCDNENEETVVMLVDAAVRLHEVS